MSLSIPVMSDREQLNSVEVRPISTRPAQQSSTFWVWCIPMIAAVLVRSLVAFAWLGSTEPHNDAADYFADASMLQGGTRPMVPFYWPPGNSYYVAGWFAVLGANMTAARVAMVVLSSLQVLLVGMLTRQLTTSSKAVMIANWIWALYPPSVFLVFQPYSQHLAAFSLGAIALSGMIWLRAPSGFAAIAFGLCCGIGCLTRPSMMTVTLLSYLMIALVASFRHESFSRRILLLGRHGVLFTMGLLAILAPTIQFNARTGGGYTLSTNNERNFFLGNNPYTPWYKTSHFAQRQLSDLPPDVQDYLRSMYQKPDRRTAMKNASVEHIRQNPGLFLLRSVNRARAFWGFDYLGSRVIKATYGSTALSTIVLLFEAAGYCAVAMLAIVAIANWSKAMTGTTLLWYLAVVAAYAFPYCIAFSGGTYHFPVMSIMVPLSAIGLVLLLSPQRMMALKSAGVVFGLLLFIAIQIEYAAFTLAAGPSQEGQSTSVEPSK